MANDTGERIMYHGRGVGIEIRRKMYRKAIETFGLPVRDIINPERDTRYLVYTTDRVSQEAAIAWAQEIAPETDFVQVWTSSTRRLRRDKLFSHRRPQ